MSPLRVELMIVYLEDVGESETTDGEMAGPERSDIVAGLRDRALADLQVEDRIKKAPR